VLQEWHAVSERVSMPGDLLAQAQYFSQQKWPSIVRGVQTSVAVPGSAFVGKPAAYVRQSFNTVNTERTEGASEEAGQGMSESGFGVIAEGSAEPALRIPALFQTLPWLQRQDAMEALKRLPQASIRQAVLDEWCSRCQRGEVRNPPKYLFGLLKRAQKGDFNESLTPGQVTAGAAAEPLISAAHRPAVLPEAPPRTPESRALARQQLASIQSLLQPALSRLKPADDR